MTLTKSICILMAGAALACAQIDDASGLPGFIDGEGKTFSVATSEYQNFTLESSASIRIRIQSIPEMIVVQIDPSADADSTILTFRGFPASAMYHRYLDNLNNHDTVRTSSYGEFSMKLAIDSPRQITIQPRKSTLFLKEDGWYYDAQKIIGADSIGYDPLTRTASINADLHQTVQIDINNVVIQGNGRSIIGNFNTGMMLTYLTKNISISNLTFTGCAYGIYSKADSCTISNCTFTNNLYGIYISSYTSGNVISANTIHNNNLRYSGIGVCVDVYASCEITGNTITNNNLAGIYLYKTRLDSYGPVAITSNTILSNGKGINIRGNVTGATVVQAYDNLIQSNVSGIDVWYANNVSLEANRLLSNTNGITVGMSDYTVVKRNEIATNGNYGLKLVGKADTACVRTAVIGNEFNGNAIGLDLDTNATANRIFQNKFQSSTQNVLLDAPGANSFDAGAQWGGNWWSDWQYTFPFEINGSTQVDNYPLAGPWPGAAQLPQDAEMPVSQASIPSPDGQNGWYIANIPVTLSCSDAAGSGVEGVFYEVKLGKFATMSVYTMPFVLSQEGINALRYWSLDKFGNKEPRRTTELKIDKTAPTITRTLFGDSSGAPGWFKTTVDFQLTATDAISRLQSLEFSLNAGSSWLPSTGRTTVSAEGVTTVDARATDSAGNISQIAFPIRIDINAPVPDLAQLPEMRTAPNVAISTVPTANDFVVGSVMGTSSGALSFPAAGTYLITWTYADGHGNSSTQQQTIVVVSDATPPVPDVASLPTITGSCSAQITTVPTATDDVSGAITGTTDDPLSYAEQGTYTVTWAYTDARGNRSTQTQIVVVSDQEAPVPDAATLPEVTGNCMVQVTDIPTATDECIGKITGTTNDPLTYTTPGTHTVTWTYSDGHGNVATQTQTFVVSDNAAPVKDVATLPTLTGECSVTITNLPTATDACAGKITATTVDPLSYSAPGTYTVHWVYDDQRGNITTQKQTVKVRDRTRPVMTNVPETYSITITNPTGTTATLPSIVATDNCDPSPVVSNSAPATFRPGTTPVILWAKDAAGNVSLAFTVVQARYNFGGFVSPTTGAGYQKKATVPVAFQLLNDAGSPIGAGAVARLYYAKMTNGSPGGEHLAGTCTYGAGSSQYKFNLNLASTASSAGEWRLRVALNDGTSQSVVITVVK